jgi:hypothetical protein
MKQANKLYREPNTKYYNVVLNLRFFMVWKRLMMYLTLTCRKICCSINVTKQSFSY